MANQRSSKCLVSGTLTLFLLGCVLPGTAVAIGGMEAGGTLSTCDLNGSRKIYYSPGDDIRYKAEFTVSGPVTVVLLRGRVSGAGLSETLPWQYGILSAGTYTTVWDSEIPSDADGRATLQVTYVGLIDEIATDQTTFVVSDSSDEAAEVGRDTCKLCHSGIFSSLQESGHVFIECELCHGAGSLHAGAPSSENITADTSAALCGRCHTLGDAQNRVEARDGLIMRNQQFDEILSGGKAGFKCVRCHDPHVSVKRDPENAIVADCTACHSETVNRIHTTAGVGCVDCHMPFAVQNETASGAGDTLEGDARSHLFTINATALPDDMFYQDGGRAFANGFLTLNFTCLGCHDGGRAKEHDFNWAAQAAGIIHR